MFCTGTIPPTIWHKTLPPAPFDTGQGLFFIWVRPYKGLRLSELPRQQEE